MAISSMDKKFIQEFLKVKEADEADLVTKYAKQKKSEIMRLEKYMIPYGYSEIKYKNLENVLSKFFQFPKILGTVF